MAHYTVDTSHGVVEFDSDRNDLSHSEVESIINDQVGSNDPPTQEPSLLQKVARFVETPKRGLRAVGVGMENEIFHPSEPGNAVLRANEALSPDYVPPSGEKIGAWAGSALDPVTMALAAAGGAPFKAASLAGSLVGGGVAGGGSSAISQLAHNGQVDPTRTAIDATIGTALGGITHVPETEGFAKAASALTGGKYQNFLRILRDKKVMLPESMGGAGPTKEAGIELGESLKNAGVDPKTAGWDKYKHSIADKETFVQQVEQDLDRKTALVNGNDIVAKHWGIPDESLPKVSTRDLVKANRATNDIIEKIPEEQTSLRREWLTTKGKIKDEIAQRSDEIADSFNKYARSKTKEDLSKILPTGNKFLMRRAALAATTYANPATGLKMLMATSPKVLSSIMTAGNVVPQAAKTATGLSIVDILKNRRKEIKKGE